MVRVGSRRGSEVIEFSLILPVMLAVVFGALDHGWFFFERFQMTQAVMQGMRAGSLTAPSELEQVDGGCADCVANARQGAHTQIERMGLQVPDVDMTPSLLPLHGVCVLQLDIAIPHDPIIGLTVVANSYDIKVSVPAQGVSEC